MDYRMESLFQPAVLSYDYKCCKDLTVGVRAHTHVHKVFTLVYT